MSIAIAAGYFATTAAADAIAATMVGLVAYGSRQRRQQGADHRPGERGRGSRRAVAGPEIRLHPGPGVPPAPPTTAAGAAFSAMARSGRRGSESATSCGTGTP